MWRVGGWVTETKGILGVIERVQASPMVWPRSRVKTLWVHQKGVAGPWLQRCVIMSANIWLNQETDIKPEIIQLQLYNMAEPQYAAQVCYLNILGWRSTSSAEQPLQISTISWSDCLKLSAVPGFYRVFQRPACEESVGITGVTLRLVVTNKYE